MDGRLGPTESRLLSQRLQLGCRVWSGYNHFTMLWAMWFARRKGIPYFLSSESYLQQRRSWWKPLIKDWLVRRIVSHARGNLPTENWPRNIFSTMELIQSGCARFQIFRMSIDFRNVPKRSCRKGFVSARNGDSKNQASCLWDASFP